MAQSSQFQFKHGVDNYAVFGNPIAHSKSPLIHSLFAQQCGEQLHYQPVLVEEGDFLSTLQRFRDEGGRGLNITLPFKGEAFASSDSVSTRARQATAVNTISIQDDGLIAGDNTDGIGLVMDLQAQGVPLDGCRVVMLGAGGAARGVIGPLLEQGVSTISIANRTLSRAEELAVLFSEYGEVKAMSYDSLLQVSADVVINATSSGLGGERPPLAPATVKGAFCYDMIYGEGSRPFLDWAESQGAGGMADGLGMLVYQAAEAFYLWRGVRPDATPVIEQLRSS